MTGIHAFTDDALGEHDCVALAELLRRKKLHPAELTEAAIKRAARIEPALHPIQFADFDAARHRAQTPLSGRFAGIPSFVKDNAPVQGMPGRNGSAAVPEKPAPVHSAFVKQYLSLGFNVLGKSTMPEFGFHCTTEPIWAGPTRNPWNPDYSSGGSSGGAAALVASGVVPIAHANDGGGSIRIPAACCGLVGLKPSRGRLVYNEYAARLPVRIVNDGVLTRSVRDTAHFYSAAEAYYKNKGLPGMRLVEGPGKRRRKIALMIDPVTGNATCPETRAVVENIARLLESHGHYVEPGSPPIPDSFKEDFADYWAFLAFMAAKFGQQSFGPEFDPSKLDGLTLGLADRFMKNFARFPAVVYRLHRSAAHFQQYMTQYDLVLSPVLAHTTPKIGEMSPKLPFTELFEKMMNYVSFTPLNNANGSPAISLPGGLSKAGLPIGVQLSAAWGAEACLLELAYEIEASMPWQSLAGYTRSQENA